MGFEVTNLDIRAASEEGIEVPIVNPKTGETTDIVITIRGMYSTQFKERASKLAAEARAARARGKKDEFDPDKDEIADLVATSTITWRGILENGKELVYSKDEAKRFFKQYVLIRNQVWAAIQDEANFIKG